MSISAIPGIRFNHVSISVADLDAQVAWYRQALGFAEVVEQYELPDPPIRTAVLQAGPGIRIEMIERGGSGASEVWPPADAVAAGARFAYVKDPEGNLIELIQPVR